MPKLVYSEVLADKICTRLESGESLNAICKDENMPSESCIRRWAVDDHKGFAAKYTRAREAGYLRLADELLDIADRSSVKDAVDPSTVQRDRLRVDTRKWLLSKMLPKVFGDKIEHASSAENPLFPQHIEITVVRPKT